MLISLTHLTDDDLLNATAEALGGVDQCEQCGRPHEWNYSISSFNRRGQRILQGWYQISTCICCPF